jgi:hypothetical protein
MMERAVAASFIHSFSILALTEADGQLETRSLYHGKEKSTVLIQ